VFYRRDVHNIKTTFNVGCVRKHSDDHTSVDVWVEELNAMGDDSPVLLYKPQGVSSSVECTGLLPQDFIICLQTITQRRFMLQFGTEKTVCLDATHGTNQYDFNMVTLMVIDDYGEGNPVAFMVCNREDETALNCFFSAIKARLPDGTDFTANRVMTDDASQYYNAWASVFGPADKNLCTWHVDRAWRRAIKEHVVDPADQAEVYHMLRSLLQELNKEEFNICLEAFICKLQIQWPRFAQYFTSTYGNRVSQWAYCYRIGTEANTNMYVESFHSVLKSAYMERKVNRRIDSLLVILFRIARDKAVERLIKMEKNSVSHKITEITKRHVILISELPESTGGGWLIPSESSGPHAYFVAPAKDSCECSMRCKNCQCCPHMYNCSCVDFAVHHTVCKHVHAVHELRRRHIDDTRMDDTVAITNPSSPGEEIADGETPCAPLTGIPAVDAPAPDRHNAELLRKAIFSKCQRIMASSNLCDDRAALHCVLSHVSAADASLRAMAKARPRGLVTARKIPANKKLDTQRRFHSTKVKRRPLQSALRKPSSERVRELKGLMLGANVATGPAMSGVDESNLFERVSQIPYCVDTEVV
jgi:MULE transposase domain